MTGFPRAVAFGSPLSELTKLWPQRSTLVATWLFTTAALVIAMVVVGGATRLTGSGLSITEWKPIAGAMPPITHADWRDLFARYKAIPQARIVNPDMSLAGFQGIFWWEWGHRLLGRLLGVVFALPLVGLIATRRLPQRLMWPCVGLFFLGGLQGLAGWWMVASGLEARLYVAPERLAVHLGLALTLFCALIWTGLEAERGPSGIASETPAGSAWRTATLAFAILVFMQCLLGAMVAGNHAGLANADWPLMSGRVLPGDYWQGSLWRTFAHGLAAVQLHHRLTAYLIGAFALALGGFAFRSRVMDRKFKALAGVTLGFVIVQIGLGIAVLLYGVPLNFALAHQLTASLLLACAVGLSWMARRAGTVVPQM